MAGERAKRFNLIFRLVCFLLVVTSFTCVALARYISSHTASGKVGLEGFRGSIQVTQTENGSSFFNSQYQVDGTVMNHPYVTDFKINNFNLATDGTLLTDSPAEVDIKYETVFYIPKQLADIAAFQLTKVNYKTTVEEVTEQIPDGEGHITTQTTQQTISREIGESQITPIYTFGDFTAEDVTTVTMPQKATRVVDKETGATEEYYEDYGMLLALKADGTPTVQETFNVTLKGTTEDGNRIIEATTENGEIKLTIEEETLEVQTSYTFQCFNTKVDGVAGDQLDLLDCLKPLEATCTQTEKFYKVRMQRPEFLLKEDKAQTDHYRMHIVPTKEFGAYYVGTDQEPETTSKNHENEMGMPFSVWLPRKSSPKFIYDGAEVKNFITDDAEKGIHFSVTENGVPHNVFPNTCIAKDFPMRINAIFMQASSSKNA